MKEIFAVPWEGGAPGAGGRGAAPGDGADGAGTAPGPLPVEPSASEACRLLCAGVHMDSAFRTAVLDELYTHEERFTAPSYGIDAGRVLAHALAARRSEFGWALGITLLWTAPLFLTRGLFMLVLWPCVILGAALWVRGPADGPFYRRALGGLLLTWAGLLLLGGLVLLVAVAFTGDGQDAGDAGLLPDTGPGLLTMGPALVATRGGDAQGPAWLCLSFLALIALAVGLQRGNFARVMTRVLSRERFPDAASDPAEPGPDPRGRRLIARVRTEQASRLVMYGAGNPFRGAGTPFRPWTLAVELRPREGREPEPVRNATILARIADLVNALKVPSSHRAPEEAAAVRDRLRELRVDSCVYLPVDGLPDRGAAPYGEVDQHLGEALEEGGEARRHFLRIRVGGWHEEVVLTVFVRAHTQGGMLMLEVAPHVLAPVRDTFRSADRQARRHLRRSGLGKALWALGRLPRSLPDSVVTLARHSAARRERDEAREEWDDRSLPEGPHLAVRELGSADGLSLFQEMDVARYLKTIQERVAGGVRQSLYQAGWATGDFEQKIVNIANGGTYIGSVRDSALGIGDHNTINQRSDTTGGPRDDS